MNAGYAPPAVRSDRGLPARELVDRVLITGLGGFVGRHLGRLLAETGGGEVYGSVVEMELGGKVPLPAEQIYTCDLLDEKAVTNLINTVRPRQIYHIAGIAEVGRSWDDPGPAYRVNVLGQLNLLQAVVAICPDSRVLVVGSAGEYGLVRQSDCPIGEDHPLRPADLYGVSKAAQDLMGQQYYLGYGTDVVRTRSFNHIGPAQSTDFWWAGWPDWLLRWRKGSGRRWRTSVICRRGGILRTFATWLGPISCLWSGVRRARRITFARAGRSRPRR